MTPIRSYVRHLIQPSVARSLVLSGSAALLGLVIAGFGLFTAQSTKLAGIPAEDVALVNDIPVSRFDFNEQVRALYGKSVSEATKAEQQTVLHDMIRNELYVQRGIELGLASDDTDVRNALVTAAEAQLATDVMTSVPTSEELRTWYAGHRAKYESEGSMTLQEFVVPRADPRSAQSIVAALRRGTTPQELALRSSGRVDDGEEFYFAARLHLGPKLFELAAGLADGAISEPIVAADGAHILVMSHNHKPVRYDFDHAMSDVLHDYISNKIAHLKAANTQFLSERAAIRIDPALQ